MAGDHMIPMGSTIHTYEDGTARVSGIDYGPKVLVHSVERECIVLRVPGHNRWSGVGNQKYESPKLLVYLIEEQHPAESPQTGYYHVRGLVEVPQGRKSSTATA